MFSAIIRFIKFIFSMFFRSKVKQIDLKSIPDVKILDTSIDKAAQEEVKVESEVDNEKKDA